MKNEITILKIRDTEDSDIISDLFLVKNAKQQALDGLQNLIDSRYDENGDWNDNWDYDDIYKYIKDNFEVVGYNEEDFEF